MSTNGPREKNKGRSQSRAKHAKETSYDTLHSVFGRRGWVVPVLLVLVLASNVIALFLPFLEITGLKKGVYSLPHTITLLWEAGLYIICILIVLFSILFPLFKNVSLICLWFKPMVPKRRLHTIHILESLGKWSMLDIYVMILILVLTSDQLFVGAQPLIGMLCFVLAIIGNMIMARVIAIMDGRAHRDRYKQPEQGQKFTPMVRAGWIGLPVPVLLIASIIAVLVTFVWPLVQINKLLMYGYEYTVWTATRSLFTHWHWGLGIFMLVFLLIMPILSLLTLLYIWLGWRTSKASVRLLRLFTIINHWAMINVFLLALGLFLIDGAELAKLRMQSGFWIMCFTVVFVPMSTIYTRIMLRRINISLAIRDLN